MCVCVCVYAWDEGRSNSLQNTNDIIFRKKIFFLFCDQHFVGRIWYFKITAQNERILMFRAKMWEISRNHGTCFSLDTFRFPAAKLHVDWIHSQFEIDFTIAYCFFFLLWFAQQKQKQKLIQCGECNVMWCDSICIDFDWVHFGWICFIPFLVYSVFVGITQRWKNNNNNNKWVKIPLQERHTNPHAFTVFNISVFTIF